MTTTSIAFVAPITIPGTTTKQTEFRGDQGWTVQPSMGRVDLEHAQHGKLTVIGVGYALREVDDAPKPRYTGMTTNDPNSQMAKDAPERLNSQPPPEEGAVVVTQAGGQTILPPEPTTREFWDQLDEGQRGAVVAERQAAERQAAEKSQEPAKHWRKGKR